VESQISQGSLQQIIDGKQPGQVRGESKFCQSCVTSVNHLISVVCDVFHARIEGKGRALAAWTLHGEKDLEKVIPIDSPQLMSRFNFSVGFFSVASVISVAHFNAD
jgi:hypothetical protein